VVTCGSVWAEPVCNAKIMARRAVEIGAAIALWQAQGGQVAFLTFTMRHREGQALHGLWEALSGAWGLVTSGPPWVKAKERAGVAGWLRAVEVTHGRNGWHVHIHALVFLGSSATAATVAELHGRMFTRWAAALERRGLSALAVAQDARLIDGPADQHLADYFTKATDDLHRLGLEFTATQTKGTRSALGTRSTWALLDDLEDLGDADALDRWHEWERGSKGRKQLTWSRGLRELLGLRREHTDEEVAGEEAGTADDTMVIITPEGWKTLCSNAVRLGELLDVAEDAGLLGVRRYLDRHGVGYVVPSEGGYL
jgi:hypothetical protein